MTDGGGAQQAGQVHADVPNPDRAMDKGERIIEMIRMLMAGKFTGYLKVNFSGGHMGRIEKFEEILKIKP